MREHVPIIRLASHKDAPFIRSLKATSDKLIIGTKEYVPVTRLALHKDAPFIKS